MSLVWCQTGGSGVDMSPFFTLQPHTRALESPSCICILGLYSGWVCNPFLISLELTWNFTNVYLDEDTSICDLVKPQDGDASKEEEQQPKNLSQCPSWDP